MHSGQEVLCSYRLAWIWVLLKHRPLAVEELVPLHCLDLSVICYDVSEFLICYSDTTRVQEQSVNATPLFPVPFRRQVYTGAAAQAPENKWRKTMAILDNASSWDGVGHRVGAIILAPVVIPAVAQS